MRNRHHGRQAQTIVIAGEDQQVAKLWLRVALFGLLATLIIALCMLWGAVDIGIAATPDVANTNSESDDSSDLLAEQLQSGEFSTAIATAKQQTKPSARQRALEQVALAQAAAGNRSSAIDTAYEIDSDVARLATIKQIQKTPTITVNARWALRGAAGGNQADFDSLIDLITTTVQPNTWKENGGAGDLHEFAGGVYCDPQGTLKRKTETDNSARLQKLQREMKLAANEKPGWNNARTNSEMRKISLVRLEAAVQRALALGQEPDEELRVLAGLERIQYVMIYPEEHDIVIAGPAGDWQTDAEGRLVSVRSNASTMHLDDLVVILRHMLSSPNATLGCSITPTKERLAATQSYLKESTKNPLPPGDHERKKWVDKIRENLGQQKIDIYGLAPDTRAARILVEADYRMKLVGIGLEPSVLGVKSYLESVVATPGKPLPPLDVLRWWFTMKYDSILASPNQEAFEFRGQGVQVQCENELLAKDGERQHTGQANDLNAQFAQSFTKHFPDLCKKYPVYADLRNLFDMALLGALLNAEKIPQKIDWHLTCFGTGGQYEPQHDVAPQWVDSVVNHRVVNQTQVLVGVSGGVQANPWKTIKSSNWEKDSKNKLTAVRNYQNSSRPAARDRWWWD